jgi:hypothetical protein
MGCLIAILLCAMWAFGSLILASFGLIPLLAYIAFLLILGIIILNEW